jgi:hypothetical protein
VDRRKEKFIPTKCRTLNCRREFYISLKADAIYNLGVIDFLHLLRLARIFTSHFSAPAFTRIESKVHLNMGRSGQLLSDSGCDHALIETRSSHTPHKVLQKRPQLLSA